MPARRRDEMPPATSVPIEQKLTAGFGGENLIIQPPPESFTGMAGSCFVY